MARCGPYTAAMGFRSLSAMHVCATGLFVTCVMTGQAQTAVPLETGACSSMQASVKVLAPKEAAQVFIDERLTVWRQRLKLDEWQITPTMVLRDDLKPKTLGGIRWDKSKKSATIWILDPSAYRLPFCPMLDDMEMTIVHELIHLKLAALPRSEASRSSEEYAVNGIAEALMSLDRNKK